MTEVIFALIQLGMLTNKVNETRLGRSEQVSPKFFSNCADIYSNTLVRTQVPSPPSIQ
jgi:hypothetical protein